MNNLVRRILMCLAIVFSIYGNLIASDICISDIYIFGNKKTKAFTILRELPFAKGDIMPEDKLIYQLKVATEHLNNTSLFNYIYIDYIPDTNNTNDCVSCIVTIKVEERWYYWPQVSLKLEDRNFSSWLHENDFSRITIGWGLRVYNVFGLGHKVSINDYFGYEKGGRISYSNIALNKQRTQMLGFSVRALFNKTLNVLSENDKVLYIKNPDNFLDKTIGGALSYTYRPRIRTTHTIKLGYTWTHLYDTVLKLNKDYWGTQHAKNNTVQLTYTFGYEHRDYIVYPTKGYYIGSELIGTAADKMNFLHSQLSLKLQYYKEIFPRWFWSSRLNASTSFKNKRAYFYDKNVGYEENNLTGYDYYVIDGQHFALMNNDIRFLIMPKKIFNLSFIRGLSKFRKIHFTLYARANYDIGYVRDTYRQPTNTLANTFLWGSGIGLDLVTYYDIVLNCSYAINKMGEGGFYFGIKAPIF